MTIRQTIYRQLAQDPELTGLLSISTIDPSQPAIYNFWPPSDTPAPYVTLTFSDAPDGIDTYQRNGTVTIDIFLTNGDRTKADKIRRRIRVLLLANPIPDDPDDGPIRAYDGQGGAGEVREDNPAVVHLNDEIELIYYDLEVIRALNNQ